MESKAEALRTRLAACKGSWPSLSSRSGVPISTLRKVAQGVIKNPGIDTFDKLSQALDQPAPQPGGQDPGRAAA